MISLIGSRRYGDGLGILDEGLMGGHDWKQCYDGLARSTYLAAILVSANTSVTKGKTKIWGQIATELMQNKNVAP